MTIRLLFFLLLFYNGHLVIRAQSQEQPMQIYDQKITKWLEKKGLSHETISDLSEEERILLSQAVDYRKRFMTKFKQRVFPFVVGTGAIVTGLAMANSIDNQLYTGLAIAGAGALTAGVTAFATLTTTSSLIRANKLVNEVRDQYMERSGKTIPKKI